MAMYLGNKKVAVTNTVEKQVPSMKAFFEAGGKCSRSVATSFDGVIKYEDTANLTDMSFMFYYCSNLTTIPQLDTSNVTNMNDMFYSCEKLTSVPLIDTSKVMETQRMFQYCSSLITVPKFDTSNVENVARMFMGCSSLITVPQFDFSKVIYASDMLYDCSSLESIHIININVSIYISSSTKFTREALLEIIGNLKAQTSGTKTLTMGSTNLAKLTDEDKAIATNKGWTLV